MARSRLKLKGRREEGTYLALPHAVLDSQSFSGLSGRAVKLLCDIARQFNGINNGDLTAAWTLMKARGWTSKDQLLKAERELRETGFIELTRQGGRHQCNLYAVTWNAIDACPGKRLDVSPTHVPSGLWKHSGNKACAPPRGLICPAQRGNGAGLQSELPRRAVQS